MSLDYIVLIEIKELLKNKKKKDESMLKSIERCLKVKVVKVEIICVVK